MRVFMKPVHIGNIYGADRGTGYAGNVWGKSGVSPTLTTMGGGNREPLIIEVYEQDSDSGRPQR